MASVRQNFLFGPILVFQPRRRRAAVLLLSDPTRHRDLHDVARAADAREARLFQNAMRGQKDAHQPDVPWQYGACQLCSSALLGEELCFRYTTILGPWWDLLALAAPLLRRAYSLFGLFDDCAAFSGPFGCRRRSLGKCTH